MFSNNIALQAAHAALTTLCITSQATVQARAHELSLAAIQPYAALVCRSNGLHPRNHVNAWTTTHLPTLGE